MPTFRRYTTPEEQWEAQAEDARSEQRRQQFEQNSDRAPYPGRLPPTWQETEEAYQQSLLDGEEELGT